MIIVAIALKKHHIFAHNTKHKIHHSLVSRHKNNSNVKQMNKNAICP